MDTYLETSYNIVSWNWKKPFKVDYKGYTTGILKMRQMFGVEITSVISCQKLNHGWMTSR